MRASMQRLLFFFFSMCDFLTSSTRLGLEGPALINCKSHASLCSSDTCYVLSDNLGAGAYGTVCKGKTGRDDLVALKSIAYKPMLVSSARPEVSISAHLGVYQPSRTLTPMELHSHVGYRHINPIVNSFTEMPSSSDHKPCILAHDHNGYPKEDCNHTSILVESRHRQWMKLMTATPLPNYWIIYPLARYGSLDHYMFMEPSVRTTPMGFARMARGILRGLSYLAEREIMWTDMKLANVLVDKDKEPLLHDFGLSRQLRWVHEKKGEQFNSIDAATLVYAPPEYVKRLTSGKNVVPRLKYTVDTVHSFDAWSLGISLLELACGTLMEKNGKHPVFGQVASGNAVEVYAAQHVLFVEPTSVRVEKIGVALAGAGCERGKVMLGKDGLSLVASLLHERPEDRISPSAALNHAFFNIIGSENGT